ncbi:MAG TPA: hypothetical protein VE046_12485 [Steroidobacteraceae bacterium]|nr:hypothetical protein [Steroidobacteraceae bacterium]
MYSLPRRPAGIGQVLDAAVLLFKYSFKATLLFAVVAGVLDLVPNIVMLATQSEEAVAASIRSPYASRSLTDWAVFFGCSLLSIMFYGAAMARAESIARGARIGIGAAFAFGLRRSLSMVLATLCYFLACGIGVLLLIVPGVILMVSLVVYLPAIVVDGRNFGEALSYSHTLVWGNWWRTSAILTVGFVFVYLLLGIIEVGLALLGQFLGFDLTTQLLVQFISASIFTVFTVPFVNALWLEIYRDLKLRTEGGDLEQRLAALRPQPV